MKYLIASKTIEVNIPEAWHAAPVLRRELSEYPESTSSAEIVIDYKDKLTGAIASNPSTYMELANGFAVKNYYTSVGWSGRNPCIVTVVPERAGKNWRKKLTNMQYTHPYEQIGQVFHESVLAPTLMLNFPGEVALLHGSSVREKDTGEALVVTGTGGVGKTLSEIEMMLSGKYEFLADDIVFLDRNGMVWPNYAYPKIYAYNVVQSPAIRSRLFHNRGIFDRVWWQISLLRGPGKVRRRCSPSALYGQPGMRGSSAPLKRLVYLFRCDTPNAKIVEIGLNKAIDMNLAVLEGEFHNILTALSWHAYNRVYLERAAVDKEKIFASWRALLAEALCDVQCQVIEVPMSFQANELRHRILPLISNR